MGVDEKPIYTVTVTLASGASSPGGQLVYENVGSHSIVPSTPPLLSLSDKAGHRMALITLGPDARVEFKVTEMSPSLALTDFALAFSTNNHDLRH